MLRFEIIERVSAYKRLDLTASSMVSDNITEKADSVKISPPKLKNGNDLTLEKITERF